MKAHTKTPPGWVFDFESRRIWPIENQKTHKRQPIAKYVTFLRYCEKLSLHVHVSLTLETFLFINKYIQGQQYHIGMDWTPSQPSNGLYCRVWIPVVLHQRGLDGDYDARMVGAELQKERLTPGMNSALDRTSFLLEMRLDLLWYFTSDGCFGGNLPSMLLRGSISW